MKIYSLSAFLRSICVCAALSAVFFGGTGCSAKAKVERHTKRADAYFAEGDLDKARIEYLNAFQLDRNDPHIAARLGETYLASGDATRAYQLLSFARELQPTNTAIRMKVAGILMLGGEAKLARAEAEKVLKDWPQHPDALLLLANASTTTNEIAAARKRLEGLASKTTTNSAVFFGLGVLAQRSGNPAAAEASFKRAVEIEPKSSRAHLALGTFYFSRGNTKKAEEHLRLAMENAPIKSVERLGFAEYLLKSGRVQEAKDLLTDAVKKEPKFLIAWNELTKISFAEKNLEQASEYISKALDQEPQNRDAILNQARVKAAKRDYPGAMTQLEQLTRRFPNDSQLQYHLATLHFAMQDQVKALAALDKSISLNTNNVEAIILRSRAQINSGNFNAAINDLTRVVRQFPRVSQPYYLLAAAYTVGGLTNEAFSVFSAIAKVFPSDPQAHQMLGASYRQRRNLPEARQSYEKALALNPDFLASVSDLVDMDIDAKQFDAAHARVRGYVEKYPDKPLPRLLQSRIFLAEQKTAEAETAALKAIELDPNFLLAHRALADVYLRTKQTDQAITKLESILQKNAKDAGILLQLGVLYEAKEDFPRARDAYEKVLQVNPASYIALNNLAAILTEQGGDLETAFRHAQKAREIAPYDFYAADTYGWILWKKGEYAQAANVLQSSADGLPDLPAVQYHLGMAHYMLGSTAPAIAALNRSLQSTNDFPGKEKAREALLVLKIDPAKGSLEDIATLNKAVAQNPADVLAHAKLAQIYEAQSAWDKARQTYEAALAKNPRSTLLLSRLAALHAGPLKQISRALELARQAWTIAQDGDLAARLAPIGYAAGDFRWAYGLLLEAQRSQPGNAEVNYYAGVTAYAMGRLPQAMDAFNRAAQSASGQGGIRNLAKLGAQLAAFHSGAVSANEAQAAISAARAIDPRFPPAAVVTGLIAERKGDFQAARSQYEAALKMHPGLLIAERQLALLLAEKLADDARAQQLIAALRNDFPNDLELTEALGKIAYRRNDYAEASRLLMLAGTQFPNDGDLLYHLGMAQYHLKDKAAKATLTRAVTLEPNGRLTADAKKAISALK